MQTSSWLRLLVLAALLPVAGCAAMHSVQMAASETVDAMRPSSSNYANPEDEASDPWVKKAGSEARGNRPKEKSEEPPWLRNLLMSPKARDIENNLGIE